MFYKHTAAYGNAEYFVIPFTYPPDVPIVHFSMPVPSSFQRNVLSVAIMAEIEMRSSGTFCDLRPDWTCYLWLEEIR